MTYTSTVWGAEAAPNMKIMETKQIKILRNITDAPWFIRNDNIWKNLKLPTLLKYREIKREKVLDIAKIYENDLPRQTFTLNNSQEAKKTTKALKQ